MRGEENGKKRFELGTPFPSNGCERKNVVAAAAAAVAVALAAVPDSIVEDDAVAAAPPFVCTLTWLVPGARGDVPSGGGGAEEGGVV